MELWQALLLGLVEGLTEYLPVSSTGHLLVTQRLLGIAPTEASNAYAIAIQAGAIAAVLGLYARRCRQLIEGLFGRNPAGKRLGTRLVVAFLPAAVLGLAFDHAIERHLFGAWPIAAAWAAGGVLILVVDRRLDRVGRYDLDSMTLRAALIIGAAQCAALWPGVSRSLATILGALGAGLSLAAAVEFSFLLGLLTLGAATSYKLLQHGHAMMEAYGPVPVVAGFVAAWLAAVVSVRFMVRWLSSHGLGLFAVWRLLAAVAVVGLLLAGVL
ncbi:MAG: undecaprenyl-diphosphate phosphatase [Polyangiales bacterium]